MISFSPTPIYMLPNQHLIALSSTDARRCENATERMMEYAATLEPKCHPTAVVKKGVAATAATGGAKKEESWRDMFVGKRRAHGLIKGRAACSI
jgi:hypothetical protein